MATGVSLKAIKPKPFQELPFRLELVRAGSKIVKDIEKDYSKTTSKWRKKPVWIREVKYEKSRLTFFVGTENEIYGYVDYGTRPHIIRPKTRQVLRFLGSSYGGRGRPKESDYVFAKFVNHPGFKGYGHSKRLQEKWQPEAEKRIADAFLRAAKQCGHQYK